jgi:hypothetical protein
MADMANVKIQICAPCEAMAYLITDVLNLSLNGLVVGEIT